MPGSPTGADADPPPSRGAPSARAARSPRATVTPTKVATTRGRTAAARPLLPGKTTPTPRAAGTGAATTGAASPHPPSPTPAARRPSPALGTLLGGRYRLTRQLAGGQGAARRTGADGGALSLWQAHDEILSRSVAVRVLAGADEDLRAVFLTTAGRGGRVTDPRVAATYDADEEQLAGQPDTQVAYLVREWVDGRSLREILLDGPLAAGRATAILREVAGALAAVHAAGVTHGAVHPDNLLIREDGQVRLTDPLIAAALAAAGQSATAPPPPPVNPPTPPDGAGFHPDQVQDITDLGRCLYAALTGRWAGGGWRGLAAAPVDAAGVLLPPRQIRAGLPKPVDAVTIRILTPQRRPELAPIRSAKAAAQALTELPADDLQPATPADVTAPVPRRRRSPWILRGVLATVVILLGVIGWTLGLNIGHVSGNPTNVPTFTPAAGSTAAPATTAALLAIKGATAFDPPPGDGHEDDNQIPLAYDGQPSTEWQTETYTTAQFGGLKSGVGLLVDLGSPQLVASVDLLLATAGTNLQLRPSNAAGTVLADFPAVAAQATSVGTSVVLHPNVKAQYWLVWLTKLPHSGSGYRGGIAEIDFHG